MGGAECSGYVGINVHPWVLLLESVRSILAKYCKETCAYLVIKR